MNVKISLTSYWIMQIIRPRKASNRLSYLFQLIHVKSTLQAHVFLTVNRNEQRRFLKEINPSENRFSQ
jgi:hypothetical protein